MDRHGGAASAALHGDTTTGGRPVRADGATNLWAWALLSEKMDNGTRKQIIKLMKCGEYGPPHFSHPANEPSEFDEFLDVGFIVGDNE